MEETARRLQGGRRAPDPFPLGWRARPSLRSPGRTDRAFARWLRARVLDRPGHRGGHGARRPAARCGARAVDPRPGHALGRAAARPYFRLRRTAAGAALGAGIGLWARQLADRGQGDVLRAPYSLALSRQGGGGVRTDRLRARGIAAVAWDSARLLVGAFETPEQATVLENQLKRAGVSATLVTRMTTTP